MAKLTKNNTYAINWLNHLGKDIDDIALELKLTKDQVVSVLEKHQPTRASDDNNPIKTASESTAKQIVSKNLMINQTSAKKSNNVMIMTKEASIINDDLKKNMRSSKPTLSKHIFKPNPNK